MGENTEFDINEAEKQLLSLMKLPTTIDNCHMILNRRKKTATCHRKLTFDFICSHGRKMPSVKESDFGSGKVGKLHAVTQVVKHTKTKGTVVKGKYHYHEFIYCLNSNIHLNPFLFEFN
jgi:hypothetical protein